MPATDTPTSPHARRASSSLSTNPADLVAESLPPRNQRLGSGPAVPKVPLEDSGGSSAARDGGDHDVGGVSVEVVAPAVVDRGRSRVGVACGRAMLAAVAPSRPRAHRT